MEIKTFWRIVIKGIGLWLVVNALYIVPQFGSTLFIGASTDEWDNFLILSVVSILVFIIYIFIVRFFLFKSEWIIDKLKLDSHFTQSKMDININSETVLRMVIIIIGALVFIDCLPGFISKVYRFIQQKELIKDYPETSTLIFYFLKTLIGYLFMTNSKVIEKYISKESRKS